MPLLYVDLLTAASGGSLRSVGYARRTIGRNGVAGAIRGRQKRAERVADGCGSGGAKWG
jgi:hypothetical protein